MSGCPPQSRAICHRLQQARSLDELRQAPSSITANSANAASLDNTATTARIIDHQPSRHSPYGHGQAAMNVTFGKSDSSATVPKQIRFVHNQGQPPSKRRRISAARRKTRCDGDRPTCSTCSKNGHRCLGYPEDSKRDPEPPDVKEQDITASSARSLNESKPQLQIDRSSSRKLVHDVLNPTADASSKGLDTSLQPAPSLGLGTGSSSQPSTAQPQLEFSSSSSFATNPPLTTANPVTNLAQTALAPSPSISAGNHFPQPSIDDAPSSPSVYRRTQHHNHRIPYFRYFGPTAIVPGFKQMVVSIRDRRMSISAGSHPGTSPLSSNSAGNAASPANNSDVVMEDLPAYDPDSPGPVHPLILHLVQTFFSHVGCNFPFLKEVKLLRHVREKRIEPILVDSICALAARFSDSPALTAGNGKMPRTERGQIFAQRAKQVVVDTFACPSVDAVQACLLMAYEGFGANQDSALWMYLGIAIRMALDLGLQKPCGIKYKGEKDPWNTQQRSRGNGDLDSLEDRRRDDRNLSVTEQRELEQERIDTFWAVFVLDRIISSGTGRPVTLRDDDFELPFPEPTTDPRTGWPTLFPVLVQIIHLYGRVSDVLNDIHNVEELTRERWAKLRDMEDQLTRLYKNWSHQLQFNVNNFKTYLQLGQGNIFILLHLWFHALFINLHQPTVLMTFGELRSELQLLPDSRELSMSSAKTICDILAFADLIDPKSFIGNPFTSQPIYIAAGAFLMESSAHASEGPSRETTPPSTDRKASHGRSTRHSLLASAASQNYQRCYNSLQMIHAYWGGIKYILTALDQKAKGMRDVETYTTEEYESTRAAAPVQGSISDQLNRLNNRGSPMNSAPFAMSFAGAANSPNSSLTLMYQTGNNSRPSSTPNRQSHVVSRQATTPPGNMVYDPIRQSLPETTTMFPSAMPQPNTSSLRHSPHHHGQPLAPPTGLRFEGVNEESKSFAQRPIHTPTSQLSNPYEGYSASPPSTVGDGVQPGGRSRSNKTNHGSYNHDHGMYHVQHFQSAAGGSWGGPMMGHSEAIMFNSQDIDIEALGLQSELMSGSWLELTNDMLGIFDSSELAHHES